MWRRAWARAYCMAWRAVISMCPGGARAPAAASGSSACARQSARGSSRAGSQTRGLQAGTQARVRGWVGACWLMRMRRRTMQHHAAPALTQHLLVRVVPVLPGPRVPLAGRGAGCSVVAALLALIIPKLSNNLLLLLRSAGQPRQRACVRQHSNMPTPQIQGEARSAARCKRRNSPSSSSSLDRGRGRPPPRAGPPPRPQLAQPPARATHMRRAWLEGEARRPLLGISQPPHRPALQPHLLRSGRCLLLLLLLERQVAQGQI